MASDKITRSYADVSWSDEWIEKAKKPRKPSDGGGMFPKPLSTATAQYNMRQMPTRGSAELLNAYRTDPWLHRAVDIIARKFASVPWNLYYRPSAGNPGKRERSTKYAALRADFRIKGFRKALDAGELKEIENHPLLDLMHTPNPAMSGNQFKELQCKYLDMSGECFTYKRKDTVLGVPYELWPISPTWVYRLPTPDMPFFDLAILGTTMRVPQEDMMWFKHPELLNPYTRGSGQGESLGSYIDTNHYAMQFQKSYFYNDARPNVMIRLPNASEDQVRTFQDQLENANRGPLRKHRPLIYDGTEDATVHEFDVAAGIDASIPLLDKVRDVIISVLGVPPEIAGILANSNKATIAAAENILARETIMPRLEFFLDNLSTQLVPDFDDKLLLGYENPVPEDTDRQLEVLKAAPWIASAGEWRELAGLPQRSPKEDDFFMVPALYTATDDASKPVEKPVPPPLPGAKPPVAALPAKEPDAKKALPPEGGVTKASDAKIKAVLKSLQPVPLTKRLDPLWQAKVAEMGAEAIAEVGANISFDMMNPAVLAHLEEFAGDRMDMVNDTTREALAEALSGGVAAGEGTDDLAARVSDVFGVMEDYRAELIARTEVVRSSNFAALNGYKQTGLVAKKEWVATPDKRTRDTHAELGEKPPIDIDEPFKIGSMEADAPGDFGEPEEDCNCRCTIAPYIDPIDDGGTDDDKGLRSEYHKALWKKFDAKATTWEHDAQKAIKAGFAEQKAAILAALRKVM